MIDNNDNNTNVQAGPPQSLDKYGRLTEFGSTLCSFLDDLKAISRAFLLTSASINDASKEPSKQFARDLAKYTSKSQLDNLIEMFKSVNKEYEGDRGLSVTLSVPPNEVSGHRARIEDFFWDYASKSPGKKEFY